MVGAPTPDVVYAPDVRHITVHGSYTLDGERFERANTPLNVIGTKRVVWGVWL